MQNSTGREKEVKLIRQANRASATARLMLGEFDDWHDFLMADVIDLEKLPRHSLKAGSRDVKRRLASEIKRFCSRNFQGMDEQKLSQLYEAIKAHRGLELPLSEFEKQFSPIQPGVLKKRPRHLTVCISLWGMQFKFPEEEMAKDVIEVLNMAVEVEADLEHHREKLHLEIRENRTQISSLVRRKSFAARSIVLSCFNLIEAYLNGLAWDYVQTYGTDSLSNRRKALLEDTSSISIRDKLVKYPEAISGQQLWLQPDEELEAFINTLKPFRDSLVHPSPFSAPEKHGGYDKLRLFYRVNYDTGLLTVNLLVSLVKRIQRHIYGDRATLPDWINELDAKVQNCLKS